jgi:ankyrin repeat protein
MPNAFQSLFAAIRDDDRVEVKELIDNEPSLARRGLTHDRYESRIAHWLYSGDTVLHVAAAGYRVEIARMLLAADADSSAAGNRRGSQPLHYAADGHQDSPSWNTGRQAAMIRLLLKAGSNIDAQDKNGATPLHRAVRTRCADAVKCLLEAGADPTIRNKPGSTAFHLAVQNTGRGGSGSEKARTAQREILEAFLERGISPSLRDAKGKSILEWVSSDWIHKILAGDGG